MSTLTAKRPETDLTEGDAVTVDGDMNAEFIRYSGHVGAERAAVVRDDDTNRETRVKCSQLDYQGFNHLYD